MKFTTITTFVFPLLISFIAVFAIPVDLESRDVYVPPILYPKQGTVWLVGEHHHVTWDTSNPPAQITNKIGQIFLRKGDLTTPVILANNFDILLGKIEITVPWVQDGDDYQVVLFGDSGNFSPKFTIKSQ
ncbi:hypothetical protein BYT27DRAFT_7101026 [Phlegmacium glaucopus]|nr:hypothetical protein BYT27DRAFT_7101026 [Phlegmacium glaucopus]